ncbi:hypothetical protein BaRGS_00023028 [Batillaria attramentaria]|uniref:Uncharacterized protein n=1 Tax=Batillaria attramentaria TaxID=370345 RepID=A0ABD0KF97_9CAEN
MAPTRTDQPVRSFDTAVAESKETPLTRGDGRQSGCTTMLTTLVHLMNRQPLFSVHPSPFPPLPPPNDNHHKHHHPQPIPSLDEWPLNRAALLFCCTWPTD